LKKAALFLFLVLTPGIIYADFLDNSSSSFYYILYIVSVIPALFWIANSVVLVLTTMHRRISSSIFWIVTTVNILLGLLSFLPVWSDYSNHNDDGGTMFTLIVLAIAPLVISTTSILLRNKQYDTSNF